MKSFAYLNDITGWDSDKNVEVLDFLNAKVPSNFEINNFPNLKLVRFSQASDLVTLAIKNCPKLLCIAANICTSLTSISIVNCHSIRALNLSFSFNLAEFNISSKSFSNLEYLSVPYTNFSFRNKKGKIDFPSTPHLHYLDICHCNNIKMEDILSLKLPVLEYLNVSDLPDNLVFSKVTKSFSSLRLISAKNTNFVIDSVARNSHLQVFFSTCLSENYANLVSSFPSIHFLFADASFNQIPPAFSQKFQWEDSAMLLYGPWPVPHVDRQNLPNSPILFSPPPQFQNPQCLDRILGAIFASGLMDMVGVGVEFESTPISYILLNDPKNPSMIWSHPIYNRHNVNFLEGTSTDDTSQAVLIIRSLVAANVSQNSQISQNSQNTEKSDKIQQISENLFDIKGVKVNVSDFAQRLYNWMNKGIEEHLHGGGLGLGATVHSVITSQDYINHPIKNAREVWESKMRRLAANGSVMRTSSCGCLCFWDDDIVCEVAKLFSQTTHVDPRCVFSSVCTSLLVARLIRNPDPNNDTFTIQMIDETVAEARNKTEGIEDYKQDVDHYVNCQKVEDLELGDMPKIGYSLKALGSAIWALKYTKSIEEAMAVIVREGGDSDTNGAVVGALMGAKYGFHTIPEKYLKYWFDGQWIWRETAPFIQMMGYEMPQSPFYSPSQ